MTRIITKIARGSAQLLGFDPSRLGITIFNTPRFVQSLVAYGRSARFGKFPLELRHIKPILSDRNESAGGIGGHYFHQDLWAARKIFQRRPSMHVDVGSRIDGFIAHLLTFMPVTVIDVRPLKSDIDGLHFIQQDATSLAGIADNSIESLSTLHAIEHFGLGRYGDPVDANACFDAMASLTRVLQPGGRLYFSVPIGRERVEFNAHRVFAVETILDAFSSLELVSFSAVDDHGRFIADAVPGDFSRAWYSCGLFEFTKS